MELKKVQKVTEKIEENVLIISEEEFTDIAKNVIEEVLNEDKKHVHGDPLMMLLLRVSYSQLAGKLHKKLFEQEKTDGNS